MPYNGILFNHESPRRGETFVTRKITRALTNIVTGTQECLHIGNLDALRDWGHARDYVEMQWLMMQQETPDDFVIATGNQCSVRDFINISAIELGLELEFKGSGKDEIGVISKIHNQSLDTVLVGDTIVKIDTRYYRPTERIHRLLII